MQLSDEKILAIGGISLAFGILIGRFLHFEYSGFSITARARSCYAVRSRLRLGLLQKLE